ncbi:hypothetical protein L1887_05340 [Cichorium endivia]|nr:hypothetical protein L1887_05340 [Cichorium endivia]
MERSPNSIIYNLKGVADNESTRIKWEMQSKAGPLRSPSNQLNGSVLSHSRATSNVSMLAEERRNKENGIYSKQPSIYGIYARKNKEQCKLSEFKSRKEA